MVADLGMSFISAFALHTALAVLVAAVWFTIPGWVVARLLCWHKRFGPLLTGLVAPALGLCTFGPVSLLVAIWRYNVAELVAVWIIFCASGFILQLRAKRDVPAAIGADSEIGPPVIVTPAAIALLLACALLAVMVAQNLFPEVRNGGLYFNEMMFDHSKIAITDSIVRQGVPPLNPFYTPGGKTVLLNYYYLWQFLASQIALLTRVSSWPIDVAMTAYTSFAAAGLVVALAVELTRRAAGGLLALLIAAVAPIADPLLKLAFPAWLHWMPRTLLLPLWLQCAWSPQHVTSGCAVVLALMLVAQIPDAAKKSPSGSILGAGGVARAGVLGLVAAAAAGSSIWVGGVAFAVTAPLLLVALLQSRLDRRQWVYVFRTIACALPITMLFFAPVLYSLLSAKTPKHAVVLGVWQANNWVVAVLHRRHKVVINLVQAVLFWLTYLPLNLGVSVIVGLPAVFARRRDQTTGQRALRLMAGWGSVGYLLVSQFMQSTLVNNDLGWRAPIVPGMLLSVWAAAALLELGTASKKGISAAMRWDTRALFIRLRWLAVPIGWIALGLGLLSCVFFYHTPLHKPETAANLAARRDLLLQASAWRYVRRFAGPTDRVQANPDGFHKLGIRPPQLPEQLFADRPAAYASRHCVMIFGFAYDAAQRRETNDLMMRIFSGHPHPNDIRQMWQVLKVKVVLVDRLDRLFNTDALQRSGLYRLALARPTYRIFVASKRPDDPAARQVADRDLPAGREHN
jgi:hypothetical protein